VPAWPGRSAVFAQVAATRGIEARGGEAWLCAPVCHDPAGLADMDRAVAVVGAALGADRPIAVYGDYDADGVTGCALLVRTLTAAGATVRPYIPHRQAEGYGLNPEALRELDRLGVETVITVDCGTTALDVARGRPPGQRLVITDHHLPVTTATGEQRLADADAVVNPRRVDDGYAFKGLAGVGVALKLAQALEAAGLVPAGTAQAQLPLVALGTVADCMPLLDENRALVRAGLAAWPTAPPGLRALSELAGCRAAPTSSDLAFSVAPRINAAGRMEDALVALTCCLASEAEAGRAAAAELEGLNQRRRAALAAALGMAHERVAAAEDAPVIACGDPAFAPGVVGLVAGRLAEEFARPAFVHSETGDEWRGSARGIAGLNVVEVLEACAPCLRRFGGHAAAGGFSLDPSPQAAAAFHRRLAEVVVARGGAARSPVRTFAVDAVCSLDRCTLQLADELAVFEPVGQGNPPILLLARDCRVVATSTFGGVGQHLRVQLQDATGAAEALTFNRPHLRDHLPEGRRVDGLFVLEADEWRGRRRARLLLRDLRPAGLARAG